VLEAPRIALINPPDIRPSVRPTESYAPPLGLASIAAYLEAHGVCCDLFDLAAQNPLSLTALERAGFFEYDLYGLTSYTKTFLAAVHLSATIRERCPNATIVFGGPHVSADADTVLRRHQHIDLIIRNEGEVPMLALLRHLTGNSMTIAEVPNLVYRKGLADNFSSHSGAASAEDICFNRVSSELPPLDSFPPPSRRYVIEPDRMTFESRGPGQPRRIEFLSTSRGCPKRCTFCSIIVMSPKYRLRSVPQLLNEVKELYASDPFGHLCFHDANFFADWRRAVDFARALYDWNPGITWSGTATVDTVVRRAESVREVGLLNCLALEVGIENGSDGVLKRLNKGITVEQCLDAVRIINDSGIHLDLDYIMFEGEMSPDELLENRDFLIESDLFDYAPFDHLRNAVRLYPGTEARKNAVRRFALSDHDFDRSLITPFANEIVATVYREMNSFLDGHGRSIELLIERLETDAGTLAQSQRGDLAQAMYKVAIELRNLPFQLFSATVEASTHGNQAVELCRTEFQTRLQRLLTAVRNVSKDFARRGAGRQAPQTAAASGMH
jgi:anaerobic magnesium-protoporphyrin IX monomethyl ester cyclase